MDHSDEKYQCKKMSDCPYTGTTVIEKIPWGDWPAGEEDAETGELDTDRGRGDVLVKSYSCIGQN